MVKIQRAPVKFIQNDKEHVLDEVVHKRCAGTKKREKLIVHQMRPARGSFMPSAQESMALKLI
jgi:hypothetical protein